MKSNSLLPILLLLMTTSAWTQGAPSAQQPSSETQAGTQPSAPAGQRAQRRAQMQAMCKEHVDAMKTDVQRMHSAFNKMKANVASISSPDEKTRWQANLDMWQTVVDHHDQMLKHMEDAQARGMGCGMMMGDMGMGGMMDHRDMGPTHPTPTPPAETKPQ